MKPLMFGERGRTLMGYFDPAGGTRRRSPVLILNPTGWEALRAHRSLRHLANRLAESGMDVLRFDYAGTGDSWGNAEDQSLSQWLMDVDAALEELESLTRARGASIIGLRAGARLALEVCARRQDVARLLLWDPQPLADIPSDDDTSSLTLYGAAVQEMARHPVPATSTRTAVALSAGQTLPSDLAGLAVEATLARADAPPCWVEERDFGAGAVPAALIADIVEWLTV